MEEPVFMGSAALGRALADVAPMVCLDIGARYGATKDLYPLGKAVHMVGLDADAEECARLERVFGNGGTPYGKLRFLPAGLSENGGPRTLQVTHQKCCSTLLEPDLGRVAPFHRDHVYRVEKRVPVQTCRLDDVVREHHLTDVTFIKMDVEGLELEILRSARALLQSTLLAIRTEAFFTPIHPGQPSYGELAGFLAEHHFVPMGFHELHHWRRLTREPHLKAVDAPIPYSRGQIMHGDVLFMRDPESILPGSEAEVTLLLREAFIAMTYDYLDHAHHIFGRRAVARYLEERSIDAQRALRAMSRAIAARDRRERMREMLGGIKAALPVLGRVPLRKLIDLTGLFGASRLAWEHQLEDPLS